MYKSNIWHWDRNSILPVFCHRGYVFVFNFRSWPGKMISASSSISWQCQNTIESYLKQMFFWSWIRLWAIFPDFCPRRATKSGASCNSHNEIYDIGIEILYFQCFATTDMLLFSIFDPDLAKWSVHRALSAGSVKTRFKAILKKVYLWSWIRLCTFLSDFCPPEGD